MSESSQTEMPMQSQPRTVVRYHILDEETHKIEEDQEAAECNESHRNGWYDLLLKKKKAYLLINLSKTVRRINIFTLFTLFSV